MSFKDHFSKHAADYAKYRPKYPTAIFEYLAAIAPGHELALDCGTGNGQAAVQLATLFDHVIATDASGEQIENAEPHDRVSYRVAPAENSGIDDGTVDLIMVAQALHWFDLDRFYVEARRLLKHDGVVAASAYNLLRTEPAIEAIVNRYYSEIVGPYWPPERALIERFTELPFPFHELDVPQFKMEAEWTVDQLLGYLWTWSSTQRFIAAQQVNPLDQIDRELRQAWGNPAQARRLVWPLALRVGRK